MVSVLFSRIRRIRGAVMNVLAFSCPFFFQKTYWSLKKRTQKACLAIGKLQRARDEWNKDGMKRLYFFNNRLHQNNQYINNVNAALFEYYQVFVKWIRPLPTEPQLWDFYHPSQGQNTGELLFITVGTGLATYTLYKHLN